MRNIQKYILETLITPETFGKKKKRKGKASASLGTTHRHYLRDSVIEDFGIKCGKEYQRNASRHARIEVNIKYIEIGYNIFKSNAKIKIRKWRDNTMVKKEKE